MFYRRHALPSILVYILGCKFDDTCVGSKWVNYYTEVHIIELSWAVLLYHYIGHLYKSSDKNLGNSKDQSASWSIDFLRTQYNKLWYRHVIEILYALPALWEVNPLIIGGFVWIYPPSCPTNRLIPGDMRRHEIMWHHCYASKVPMTDHHGGLLIWVVNYKT